jgi:ribosome-associated protein
MGCTKPAKPLFEHHRMTDNTNSADKKDIQKLQRAIVDGLEDVKAQDIQVFDTEHITSLFERVIVASGTSNRQTKALAASVRDAVREAGFGKPRIEGEQNGEWIIVDCGAAVAHIMQPTIRQYYHLEELWGDKPVKLKLGAVAPLVKASRAAALAAAEAAAVVAQAPSGRTAARTVARNAARKAGRVSGEPAPVSTKTAAKKAPAKRGAAKAAPKPSVKAAVKAIVTNTAPPKATAKPRAKPVVKSVAAAPVKAAPVKRAAPKSLAAKTAALKKPVAPKVATKPVAAKKVVAKKVPAKKVPAKKVVAKKTPRSA